MKKGTKLGPRIPKAEREQRRLAVMAVHSANLKHLIDCLDRSFSTFDDSDKVTVLFAIIDALDKECEQYHLFGDRDWREIVGYCPDVSLP